MSGERPAGGSQQNPVACGEPGAAGLAAQHPKLMPQHQDLQVLGAVIGVRQDQQASDQPEYESIEGWYEMPAHAANPRFRAPQPI
jgi:hypothetical protein